jgi:hypothetical protein
MEGTSIVECLAEYWLFRGRLSLHVEGYGH